MGKADPDCAWCQGTGKRKTWDLDPETGEYGWIDVKCYCAE